MKTSLSLIHRRSLRSREAGYPRLYFSGYGHALRGPQFSLAGSCSQSLSFIKASVVPVFSHGFRQPASAPLPTRRRCSGTGRLYHIRRKITRGFCGNREFSSVGNLRSIIRGGFFPGNRRRHLRERRRLQVWRVFRVWRMISRFPSVTAPRLRDSAIPKSNSRPVPCRTRRAGRRRDRAENASRRKRF